MKLNKEKKNHDRIKAWIESNVSPKTLNNERQAVDVQRKEKIKEKKEKMCSVNDPMSPICFSINYNKVSSTSLSREALSRDLHSI